MEKFNFKCSCGRSIDFESNQPGGSLEPVICKCYKPHNLKLPEFEGKHQYQMREKTRQLREHIISVYQSYRDVMTVRQMFYRLLNFGYDKTERFYSKVQRQMQEMRLSGALPFELVADNTRSFYKPRTYRGLESMLQETKHFYRRDLWDQAACNVEIWLEKEALRGVFNKITNEYDVPLFVSRGFSSLSFVYDSATEIKHRNKPTYVYLFTDHDPSGIDVAKSIEKRFKEFGAGENGRFQRIGLTSQQIQEYNLPERPTKKGTHSKNFKGKSVELDAMEPRDLRALVEGCILRHIDQQTLDNLKRVEELEKETLDTIINNLGHAS